MARPLVQKLLRVTAFPLPSHTAKRWGMAGSSLGGLITCYAAWTRPTVWGSFAACMSSSAGDCNCAVGPASRPRASARARFAEFSRRLAARSRARSSPGIHLAGAAVLGGLSSSAR